MYVHTCRYLLGPDWIKPFIPLAAGLASLFLKTPEQVKRRVLFLQVPSSVFGLSECMISLTCVRLLV